MIKSWTFVSFNTCTLIKNIFIAIRNSLFNIIAIPYIFIGNVRHPTPALPYI